MTNERAAVRQRLADAYRGHLQLVAGRLETLFREQLSSLDSIQPMPEGFAREVHRRELASLILLGPESKAIYPSLASAQLPSGAAASTSTARLLEAETVQSRARNLLRSGDIAAATRLIVARFSDSDLGWVIDANGRMLAANSELMLLEAAPASERPSLALVAERLRVRVNDYGSPLSSAQRRFLMREILRLSPNSADAFPTWSAENLAAHYLESAAKFPAPLLLERTPLPGIWHSLSPERRVVALLSTARMHHLLREAAIQQPAPDGVSFRLLPPFEDEPPDPASLLTSSAGRYFPGWKLALLLEDHGLFETTSKRKVTRYLWTAVLVIAAMSVLAVLIARAFAHQLQLTRLKNDLVATVSHELKTPLTSMRVLVDTLLESEKLHEPTTREYLQLISQENTRLSRLIDNVLTFSRIERNKLTFDFAETSPSAVVADAIAAMGERCHAPCCRFEAYTAPDLPLIHADRDALATAILNLLDNAWKYSADDKRITLRTEARNGTVTFTVEDNGIGVGKREARKIFRRFYQVDHRLSRSTGGCGLGLSIVEQIVSAHGGEVHVVSEPQEGSRFTIEIPAIGNDTPV